MRVPGDALVPLGHRWGLTRDRGGERDSAQRTTDPGPQFPQPLRPPDLRAVRPRAHPRRLFPDKRMTLTAGRPAMAASRARESLERRARASAPTARRRAPPRAPWGGARGSPGGMGP